MDLAGADLAALVALLVAATAICTSLTAMVIQTTRLLRIAERYMVELKRHNVVDEQ